MQSLILLSRPGWRSTAVLPGVEDLLRSRHSTELYGVVCILMSLVSHETIYTAIYAMALGELRNERIACLRQSRTNRPSPCARGGSVRHDSQQDEHP